MQGSRPANRPSTRQPDKMAPFEAFHLCPSGTSRVIRPTETVYIRSQPPFPPSAQEAQGRNGGRKRHRAITASSDGQTVVHAAVAKLIGFRFNHSAINSRTQIPRLHNAYSIRAAPCSLIASVHFYREIITVKSSRPVVNKQACAVRRGDRIYECIKSVE